MLGAKKSDERKTFIKKLNHTKDFVVSQSHQENIYNLPIFNNLPHICSFFLLQNGYYKFF